MKVNSIAPTETTCSICGFLLDVDAVGKHKRWYNFIVECEYHFLRNIYRNTNLQNMKIDNIKKYYEIFDRLVELSSIVENALEGECITSEFQDFVQIELDGAYSTIQEIKNKINNIVVKKMFCKTKTDFADKIINFIYSSLIKFVTADKIKGIPLSKNFIENLKGIMNNKTHIHHSHIQEKLLVIHTATAISS